MWVLGNCVVGMHETNLNFRYSNILSKEYTNGFFNTKTAEFSKFQGVQGVASIGGKMMLLL